MNVKEICFYCGEPISKPGMLKHQQICLDREITVYPYIINYAKGRIRCIACGELLRKRNMKKHIERCDNEIEKNECPKCQRPVIRQHVHFCKPEDILKKKCRKCSRHYLLWRYDAHVPKCEGRVRIKKNGRKVFERKGEKIYYKDG